MIRARATNQSNAATHNGASPRTTPQRTSRPARRKGGGGGVPFSVLIIVVILTLSGFALMSIKSMLYVTETMDKPPPNREFKHISPETAQGPIQDVRIAFAERYGPQTSKDMLKKGVQTFGSMRVTAERMLLAAQAGRPFVMAFSGYSVTVGRGNFFNQSFPFVLHSILEEPLQQILGIPLVVRNGAIGGIPSFPYGFCMEHFLGNDPDVISWDYSMNEGAKDASVLEAFLRQATQQLPKRPMLIMLDQNQARTKLLSDYAGQGFLSDAIAVGKKDILDDAVLQSNPLPPGFQEWDEFGAPKNCPGRGSWHPKKQEHAMIGWMMAMHFVDALEMAVDLMQESQPVQFQPNEQPTFPKPLTRIPSNDAEVSELLYGHDNDGKFIMKDLSCRTSFLPATDESRTIPSIVVAGLAEGDLDIMIDRTDGHYQEGWVLDVSKMERDTKRKVERCGGLGYLDMKIALYGIPESGKLRLWLPFEGEPHAGDSSSPARTWFDDFIICEANEKRGDNACKLDQDMDVVVGGSTVTSISTVQGAAAYLKRTTCVNVGVPPDAHTTKLSEVRSTDGRPLSTTEMDKFGVAHDTVGLLVDITAKAQVTRSDGACCLSHVVWETH